MKKQGDRYISVGRGGGTVKVKAGKARKRRCSGQRVHHRPVAGGGREHCGPGAAGARCLDPPRQLAAGELFAAASALHAEAAAECEYREGPAEPSSGGEESRVGAGVASSSSNSPAQESQVEWYLKLARWPLLAILLVQGGTVLRLGQALLAASPSLVAWAS